MLEDIVEIQVSSVTLAYTGDIVEMTGRCRGDTAELGHARLSRLDRLLDDAVYLPSSPYISPYLPVYLPISPNISPYLPTSPPARP